MPRQRPLFLVQDPDRGGYGASPETGVPPSAPDYRHYSDEQLFEERERRLRSQAGSQGAPIVDEQVDQITDELIRRARLRHPSARGRAG
jgi:hypothetical protein